MKQLKPPLIMPAIFLLYVTAFTGYACRWNRNTEGSYEIPGKHNLSLQKILTSPFEPLAMTGASSVCYWQAGGKQPNLTRTLSGKPLATLRLQNVALQAAPARHDRYEVPLYQLGMAVGMILSLLLAILLLRINFIAYQRRATRMAAGEDQMQHRQPAENAGAEKAYRQVQDICLANMRHTVRTSIHGITGMSHLLRQTPLTGAQQAYADAIAASAEKLMLRVNDYLDLSHIRTGRLPLEKEAFSLSLLLHKAIAGNHPAAAAKGLGMYCDVDERIPPHLHGDRLRLGQVFNVLLENAVRFTVTGDIELTAMLLEEYAQNVRIGVNVSDTGTGILPDQQEALFGNAGSATPQPGLYFAKTSRRLSLCQEIVQQHGGNITVRSELGKGTTMYVELSLEKCSAETAFPTALTGQCLEDKRILLAEDTPVNQQVARYTLQQRGAIVAVAADGLSVMQLLMQGSFDCLLLELRLPEMNGHEIVSALRRMGITTPAIAITASGQQGEKEKALSVGFYDCIAKPFPPDELVHKILAVVKPGLTASFPMVSAPVLVDFNYLCQLTENDPGYLRELLDTFCQTTPAYMEQLALSLNEKRWEALQFEAHRLRASLSVVRIPALTQLMVELEKEAIQQSDNAAQQKLHAAQLCYEEAKAAIAVFRQTL